jgi:hypothetical protein
MRTCPMCGNEADDDATTCICGYAFRAQTELGEEVHSYARSKPAIVSWGWGLLAVGALAAIGSFFMPTSVQTYASFVEDGVHNVGLMQQQMMVFQAGLCAVLSGIVCLAAGAIIEALRQANRG